MKIVIPYNAISHAPAYEEAVPVIIMTVVPFDQAERRSGSRVKAGIGTTKNFTVSDSHILSYLPADSITIEILNGNIFNCGFIDLMKVYPSGSATVNHIIGFPAAINSQTGNPDIFGING